MRRRRPALFVAIAMSVVAALCAAAPAATESAGLGWRVEQAPFRLTFHDGGKQLVAQAKGETTGPGGRMSYALADGSMHRLTSLLDQHGDRHATTYTVATDEPDRTATVVVSRTPRGLRVSWTFQPATGVTQVHESLTGDDAEHFLGGGANFLYTDLRHRVLLNKVRFTGASALNRCNSGGAPSPFFASSRGYAIFPDTGAIGRLAFPNAVDDPPSCVNTPPPCPVLLGQPDRTQLCFKTNRLDYEVYAGSPAEVGACLQRSRGPACVAAAPAAGADVLARHQPGRPAAGAGRHRAAAEPWHPGEDGVDRQPVGDQHRDRRAHPRRRVQRHTGVRPGAVPGPTGHDRRATSPWCPLGTVDLVVRPPGGRGSDLPGPRLPGGFVRGRHRPYRPFRHRLHQPGGQGALRVEAEEAVPDGCRLREGRPRRRDGLRERQLRRGPRQGVPQHLPKAVRGVDVERAERGVGQRLHDGVPRRLHGFAQRAARFLGRGPELDVRGPTVVGAAWPELVAHGPSGVGHGHRRLHAGRRPTSTDPDAVHEVGPVLVGVPGVRGRRPGPQRHAVAVRRGDGRPVQRLGGPAQRAGAVLVLAGPTSFPNRRADHPPAGLRPSHATSPHGRRTCR